ncbi:MAG: WbuC family cupin fold metalloprotein [Bacteroidaceae bacterium]|nr:WbuC family cupin fold metalloprotein [Bacteroidaceae bacterium]MBQ9191302.1 WbuC family cupin fold metalloprotein [Bacteroidaceae bacterium]
MELNDQLLNELAQRACASERLRMNFDLRTSAADQSQRMLNALEPDTVLPIHRHMKSTEVVVVLRGRMDEIFYDDQRRETARYHLDPKQGVYGLSIPVGQWHGIEVFEPTVILECKDGAYEPLAPEDVL